MSLIGLMQTLKKTWNSYENAVGRLLQPVLSFKFPYSPLKSFLSREARVKRDAKWDNNPLKDPADQLTSLVPHVIARNPERAISESKETKQSSHSVIARSVAT